MLADTLVVVASRPLLRHLGAKGDRMSQEAGTTQKLFTYLIIPADEAKPIRRTAAMMRVKPEEQELRAIIEPYLDGFIMILVTALIGDDSATCSSTRWMVRRNWRATIGRPYCIRIQSFCDIEKIEKSDGSPCPTSTGLRCCLMSRCGLIEDEYAAGRLGPSPSHSKGGLSAGLPML
jgi:hypothetical protein